MSINKNTLLNYVRETSERGEDVIITDIGIVDLRDVGSIDPGGAKTVWIKSASITFIVYWSKDGVGNNHLSTISYSKYKKYEHETRINKLEKIKRLCKEEK
jgi:hypothetical protein